MKRKRKVAIATKPDRFKAYVLKHCEILKRMMYLDQYKGDIEFDVDLNEDQRSHGGDSLAQTTASTEYKWYKIEVAPELRHMYEKHKDSFGVFSCLVHEMLHVVTHRLTYLAEIRAHDDAAGHVRYAIEEQTTWLERIVIALIPESEYRIR
jgi:hypothetical protein